MFHFCKIPNLSRPVAFKRQFTEGQFGVTIKAEKEKTDELQALLNGAGASLVEIDYAG
jgi:hypothetical protein